LHLRRNNIAQQMERRMDYQNWVGRTEVAEEAVTLRQAAQMAALLDQPCDLIGGSPMPPLWHWMAFAPIASMSALGPDGHPARGGFLPPVPLERRMWAGGRLVFHAPLSVGNPMVRRSEIVKVVEKQGAAGPMVFVTVVHTISQNGTLCVTDEQDLVFVAIPPHFTPPAPQPVPTDPLWRQDQPIDPVRLFRFSAITFNGHRIHYDLEYAQKIEHYPGLVVHGPYQALLLMDAASRRKDGVAPARYSYRGVRPLFHTDRMELVGLASDSHTLTLCTANGDGLQCMQAKVEW
jgi:3-methylfumaryl-CoA hydratase